MSRTLTEIRISHAENIAELKEVAERLAESGQIVYHAYNGGVFPCELVGSKRKSIELSDGRVCITPLGEKDQNWVSLSVIFETAEDAMDYILRANPKAEARS